MSVEERIQEEAAGLDFPVFDADNHMYETRDAGASWQNISDGQMAADVRPLVRAVNADVSAAPPEAPAARVARQPVRPPAPPQSAQPDASGGR